MNAQTHYDAKAAQAACGQRTELQRFHNRAKRALLTTCASGCGRLLDLACGRGGDIHKWRQLGVAHVTGLDVSGESVNEARARLQATGATVDYQFEQADLRQPWRGAAPYDVATCMFALHYFFESEASAKTLLETVAANLRPGGVFVGIVPDGQQVNERIKHGDYDNGALQVKALWQGKPACFGSAYTCSIAGTVTEQSHVPEYLVYSGVLEKLAGMYGLHRVPLHDVCFQDAGPGLFQHLRAPYQGPEEACSSMYAAFALKKSGT